MTNKIRTFLLLWRRPGVNAGKVTVIAMAAVALVSATTLYAYFQLLVPIADAANVSTSLNVLNTPPNWTVNAHEDIESSTSTPTNAGATLTFDATATDSSSDNYWLLICSASSTPVAHNNAPPTCGSGIMWARSATTTSGQQAQAATTTKETAPFANEENAWYGYICDGNSTGAQCNAVMENNDTTNFPNKVSPFIINHPPVFSAISNNSPQDPGGTVTWTATAYDNDTIRGGDTVRLIVCKANDFSGGYCGAGGTWATSTAVSSNPATSTILSIPLQDKTYNAYVYLYDQNTLVATSTSEGSNSSFVVNNVAPIVTASTMVVGTSTGNIILTQPHATSGPFVVKFTVVDNNSCQNTSSGNELSSATTTIYRSGIGSNACQVSGDYNTNSCYPSSNSQTQMTCTQDAGSCSGATDSDATWTCTFNLWYNADATDPGSFFAADNWLAGVQVTDDNGLLSSFATSTTGNEVQQFLAFNVSQTGVSFGGLQPGQQNDPLATTTDLVAWGNVGMDESLYGDTMCTTWTSFDSCDAGGPDATRKIPIGNQKAATSSVAYGSSQAYTMTASTSPLSVGIHVPKTTSTSSSQTKNTWWGINVPSAITVAGAYSGRNVITAVTSNSSFW